MQIFTEQSLNHILQLFELNMPIEAFERNIFHTLSFLKNENILESSPNSGNILSTICLHSHRFEAVYFEDRFIILINTIVHRLCAYEQKNIGISLFLNRPFGSNIFMLLINNEHIRAAEGCLRQLQELCQGTLIHQEMIVQDIFKKDIYDNFLIEHFSKNLSQDKLSQLSYILATTVLNFAAPTQLIKSWLLSTVQLNDFYLQDLLLSRELSRIQKQEFLKDLILFCDFEIISSAELLNMLYPFQNNLGLLDFIITKNDLDLDAFQLTLSFYKDLYRHHHLTTDEYERLILSHPRPGFSPMHELILKNHRIGLDIYLGHLNCLLEQQLINREKIQAIFTKTNTRGFSNLYQACNSFDPEIARITLKYLEIFFDRKDMYHLICKGCYNPLYKKYLRPRCGDDKPHAPIINEMLSQLRLELKDELMDELLLESLNFFSLSLAHARSEETATQSYDFRDSSKVNML